MPYDEPDPDDPHVLVGVSLPAGEGAVREMAAAFAEEFAAMGFDEDRILGLFQRPFYAGAHRALRALGENEIRKIIRESVQVWGRFRVVVTDSEDDEDDGGLVRIERAARVHGPIQDPLDG